MVVFNFNKESMADPEKSVESAEAADQNAMAEVCTNYRYAKRHDPAHMPKADEEKKDDQTNAEA